MILPRSLVMTPFNLCRFCDNRKADYSYVLLAKGDHTFGWLYCSDCEKLAIENEKKWNIMEHKPKPNKRNILKLIGEKNTIEFTDGETGKTFFVNLNNWTSRISLGYNEIIFRLFDDNVIRDVRLSELIAGYPDLFGVSFESQHNLKIDTSVYEQYGIDYWKKQLKKSYKLAKNKNIKAGKWKWI